jgi:RNA 3'-terminal phosphate cyclase (ATP)
METNILQLDGSQGEGGGQILRSALALSVLLRRPMRLSRIRAGRSKPGLMRQHLACVLAAKQLSAADVQGAELGSTELTFKPHTLMGGTHMFRIGGAGSTMLVLQTVLPMLLRAPDAARIGVDGGTHNPLAPSADFLQQCFLPQLVRMGARVQLEVQQPGFHPAGGGKVLMQVQPSVLQPLSLTARGESMGVRASAMIAGLPTHIAERELNAVANAFHLRHAEQRQLLELSGRSGCANVLSVSAHFAHVSECVTVHGERGLRAESVAAKAVKELKRYLAHTAAVGEHLADQLLLPCWLAGSGEFTTGEPSPHLLTNAKVLEAFGAAKVHISKRDSNWLVRVQALQPPM